MIHLRALWIKALKYVIITMRKIEITRTLKCYTLWNTIKSLVFEILLCFTHYAISWLTSRFSSLIKRARLLKSLRLPAGAFKIKFPFHFCSCMLCASLKIDDTPVCRQDSCQLANNQSFYLTATFRQAHESRKIPS